MKSSTLVVGVMMFCFAARAAVVTVGPWVPVFQGIELASGQQEATVGGEYDHRTLCYRVDLQDPNITLFTTPKCTNCGTFETLSENTSLFLEEYGVQAAINGGFYSSSLGPNDVPLGTPENVRGLAISEGTVVSPSGDSDGAATLLFTTNNQPTFVPLNIPGVATDGIYTAISGDRPLLTNGVIAQVSTPNDRDPRTAIGISEDRRYLFLMTLDGRQNGWSDGADWYSTAQWLQRFGAYDAINIDGGGSTTMVMADCQGKAVRLNRSSFVASYGRERIIGHNFGIRARPLPSALKNLQITPGGSTATMTWETDEAATTQVQYGPTSAYGSATPLDQRLRHKHVATLTGLAQGSEYFFQAISTGSSGSLTQGCTFATLSSLIATNIFGLTQEWSYETNNLNGVNWKAPGYNDSAWLGQGPGLLYALENSASVSPRNTRMPPTSGNSIPRTYYFRTHFNFTGSTDGISLVFSNYVDDGAVFYLNGTEIYRLRMPAAPAPIANSTSAIGTPCSNTAQAGDALTTCPDVFTVSGDLLSSLVQGDNVIAVEVHNATSSDLVFGSALIQLSPVQSSPVLNVLTEGDISTLFWNESGFSLQESSDLGSAGNWSDISGSPRSPVTVTNSVSSTYFRLRN